MSITKGYMDNRVKTYLEHVNELKKSSAKMKKCNEVVDLIFYNPIFINDYILHYIEELDNIDEYTENTINFCIVNIIYDNLNGIDEEILKSRKEMVEEYKK